MTIKLDKLGSITFPSAMMKQLGIEELDEIDIESDDNAIIIRKHIPTCIFCHSCENLHGIKGKWVCKTCIDRLHEAQNGEYLY